MHHGNGMAQQTFSTIGQNSQHSPNLGVHSHTISPPVPPPIGHSHQETSWAPRPPSRVLPPPPSSSQGQILHNHHLPPPPPPPFHAPSPGGVYGHSTVGNYHHMPSVAPPPSLPPLPRSPPPALPSPPPPAPLMASTSSQAACTNDPCSTEVPSFEPKALNSVEGFVASGPSDTVPVHNSDNEANQDAGNCGDVALVSLRDELLPTKSVVLDLPPPLPHPAEENTVSADSDMEMEDDITLSDKDQGSTYATEGITQPHDRVDEVFSINEKIQRMQSSTQDEPAKGILSSGVSCFGSTGVSKQNEGLGPSSDVEPMKSARSATKVLSPLNDSIELAESLPITGSGRLEAPLDKGFIRNGASDHGEATDPNRDSEQLMRIDSPIRLLQNYASDETSDNEDDGCTEDANNVFTVSTGADSCVPDAFKDSKSNLETGIGLKSPSYTQKATGLLSKSSQNNSEISPCLVQVPDVTGKRSVSRISDGCVAPNLENQVSVNFSSSIEALQGEDRLGDNGLDIDSSKSGPAEQNCEKETSKFEPTVLKVDEFGRHIKEGASDSGSDESRSRRTKRINKRDRSRSHSRSRSPIDRRSRRRRRSPRRRKDKRSLSRSWSPRRRRSRSRSPILRRSGDIHGENVRRDKDQCFDFLRRKCYRGALCRFAHHESDRSATSRRSRNKHDLEFDSREKSSRVNEEVKSISSKVSDYEHDGVRNQDTDLHRNITGQEVVKRKEDSEGRTVVSTTFGIDGLSVNSIPSSEGVREVSPKVHETLVVGEKPKTSIHESDRFQNALSSHQQHLVDVFQPEALSHADASKPSGGTSKDVFPSEDGSFVQQLQSNVSVEVPEHSGGTSKDVLLSDDGSFVQHLPSNVSVGVPEHSGYPSQLLNVGGATGLSSDKRSANEVSGSEPLPFTLPSTQLHSATSSVGPCVASEQPSLHPQSSKELPPQSVSSVQIPLHTYPLPAFAGSHFQSENAVHAPQIPRQYGVVQQNALFPFQSPYPPPLQTPNSHFSVPPHSSWTSLPPPPPPQAVYNSSSNLGVVKSFISSEFNQNQLHSRTDYVSQTSLIPGLPSNSQNSKFEDQAYPPMQDHLQTFVRTEPLSPKHLHQGHPAYQSLSSSTSFGGLHHQPKQFSWESDVNRPQPSLGSRLPPEGHFSTSSQIHPLAQQQQSVHNFQYTSSDVNLTGPGGTATVSRYPPDIPDSNHSTSLPAFGASRVSAHYNPYASTFEQPLSSKFSSSFLRQENDIVYGKNYGPSRYREGDSAGSRHTASPKPAGAVDRILPGSGEQYDPLFDSIEPSSSLKKFDFEQKQEVTGESNFSLRPKSSHMSLDAKEKKHEKVGAVASTSSLNNDEYGETADAEVGVVDNESLSNDVDVANMSPEEDEINQTKSPGKRKKSKDSRSMKLFKVSIANFVKEVLKPSWRQGNMSKVAFKTIVKKTVDKVSGAMKGHRIPKSQEKISQYIDSSQRKLTKLVMGYVDKYVKV
ncbi:hypothetical protein KIW84_013545 [Lathyrus oleraceus]|uniref:C3H1-type domain-containing protein n=2 Tax=Pisum sativum TaxID=3888 RepID=A0A9D5GYA6_PEA|nr:hypothetical protein KIW84_013545 [Pisum sativum]